MMTTHCACGMTFHHSDWISTELVLANCECRTRRQTVNAETDYVSEMYRTRQEEEARFAAERQRMIDEYIVRPSHGERVMDAVLALDALHAQYDESVLAEAWRQRRDRDKKVEYANGYGMSATEAAALYGTGTLTNRAAPMTAETIRKAVESLKRNALPGPILMPVDPSSPLLAPLANVIGFQCGTCHHVATYTEGEVYRGVCGDVMCTGTMSRMSKAALDKWWDEGAPLFNTPRPTIADPLGQRAPVAATPTLGDQRRADEQAKTKAGWKGSDALPYDADYD